MRVVCVMAIEGVLSETPNLLTSPPRKQAKGLYDALRPQYRMVLLSAQSDQDIARYWLKKEGFAQYAMVMCYSSTSMFKPDVWKVEAVREMLSEGWDVGFVIDSDPRVTNGAHELGVPVMLAFYPLSFPGRLPVSPGPLRSWDEIE